MAIPAINTANINQAMQVRDASSVQAPDAAGLSAKASLPVPDDAAGFVAVSPEALAALLIKMYGNDRKQSRTSAIKRESLAHEHGMKQVDEMNKAAELRATQTRWEAGLQVVGGSLQAAGALASIASSAGKSAAKPKPDSTNTETCQAAADKSIADGSKGANKANGAAAADATTSGANGDNKDISFGEKLARNGAALGNAANAICVGAGRFIGSQPGLDAGHADAAAKREATFAEEAKSQAERARDDAKTASKHVAEVIDFLRSIVETKHDTQKSAMLRA